MTDNNETHRCSHTLICKSTTCHHAIPHEPNDCDSPAPCGVWPNKPNFQPRVCCIPKEQVKPIENCSYCGKKEGKHHHPNDCRNTLKEQLAASQSRVEELVIQLNASLAAFGENERSAFDIAFSHGLEAGKGLTNTG